MAKIIGKGSLLKLEIATVFTTIAQLTSIKGPGAKPQTYDATALDSGAGMEHKPTGFVDGGTVQFEGFFDPTAATHKALTALITTPAVVNWKTIFADGLATVHPYAGVLTNFEPSITLNDGTKFSAEITLDGIVTYPT